MELIYFYLHFFQFIDYKLILKINYLFKMKIGDTKMLENKTAITDVTRYHFFYIKKYLFIL